MSLGKYAWGEENDTVYAHMFLGGSVELSIGNGVKIECKSDYPRKGNICYTINPSMNATEFCFAVHIPEWCRDVVYMVNGEQIDAEIKDGYVYFSRRWEKGDTLEIKAQLPVLRIYSNLAVSGNAGQISLQKGPIVYCFEEVDNGKPLAALRLPVDSEIIESEIKSGELSGTLALTAKGIRETGDTNLYTEQKPKSEPVTLQAVPYYTWGNRDSGEMRVWIRQ